MQFQILAHACLVVRSRDKTLVIDPWTVGSCYWRSWWNYPPVSARDAENLKPDAIYITHSHWDHFHGPSLKKFAPTTPIFIPYERSLRMKRDLAQMGFANVVELPHGRGRQIADDFRITPYQFGSPWGDSAVIVEAEGLKLFNANDAKLMGPPLEQILRRHGRFDFAFRSHSSANDRACFHFIDGQQSVDEEDVTLYAKSWVNFMNRVKPRYAVPFASNHCYLHRDVFHFNRIIETPLEVQNYVAARGGLADSELKIMASGDSWDSGTGFHIRPQSYFADRETHLRHYLEAKAGVLAKTYRLEDRARVTLKEFTRFFERFVADVPRFLKRSFRGKPIIFCATSAAAPDYFSVDLFSGRIVQLSEAELPRSPIIYEANAKLLKMAMAANMFGQVGISKRVKYRLNREDAKHLNRFKQLLSAYEHEVLPISRLIAWRTFRVYMRRWREVLLYIRLIRGIRAGKSLYDLEEQLLSTPSQPPVRSRWRRRAFRRGAARGLR
jgi:UDP-MurNAc hydroxylase